MKVWIWGAGAIGSVVAGKLRVNGDCLLIDGWRDHVEAIRERGLTVDYPEGRVNAVLDAVHRSELGPALGRPDLVLLAVKSNETAESVAAIEPYLSTGSFIVSLQNGMNEETIARMIGSDRTIGATVRFDGQLLAPGHARCNQAHRRLVLGEMDGRMSDRLRTLAELFRTSVAAETTDNISGHLWAKLVRNCEFNAVAATTGLLTEQIVDDHLARAVALNLGMEAVRVALRLGVRLDPEELLGPPTSYLQPLESAEMRAVESLFVTRGGSIPGAKASMLQDVERGRPTEIDYLNGYVVKRGRECGVPTPFNEAMIRLVKRVETNHTKPDADLLAATFGGLLSSHA